VRKPLDIHGVTARIVLTAVLWPGTTGKYPQSNQEVFKMKKVFCYALAALALTLTAATTAKA
jgi:hypothetical protein